MTELESLVALNMIEGLGPITVKRLLERFGSAGQALRASEAELRGVEGLRPEALARIRRGIKQADVAEEMEKAGRAGIALVPMSDQAYPELLKQIYDPPPLLYVRGTLSHADRHAVAIVGSRRCSHYGVSCAERLASQLAARGFTVVSGMARGIDTAAHRGALKAGGRTIAVLGSGLNRIYPSENRGLADEIEASGAVISEFPMDTSPHRTNFPLRNRLISGLSLGVVVVEAARRSGSLITAAQALEQGRAVFAVPGRIDSFSSQGTHALLKDGAKLVESVEDIVEEFPYLAGCERGPTGSESPLPRPRLEPGEEKVLECLSSGELSIDEITTASGLTPAAVSAALLSLEIKHLVNQLPGKMFRKAR